ncbi:hypothetical protein TrLO_g2454 [Triparma laevis f. longispina]|uniref:FHA domain-containing protein n=1 Tax=Triparma laevis f. longispina TaxID=1714387 RepID=A0A9W7FLP8_9STRA|nr:hypothetical protein TrLO_g2454 [Triparma laevis f. longispina]
MAPPPTPKWCVPPSSGWYLEALKGGVSRGLLSLGPSGPEAPDSFEVLPNSSSQFLIGRGEDCEIEISSPLASRLHSSICFRVLPTGLTLPYIYDCDSSHGVYLNLKETNRLPSKKWSELYSGDMLQFGECGGTGKVYLLRHVKGENEGEELDRTKVWSLGGEKGRAVISSNAVFESSTNTVNPVQQQQQPETPEPQPLSLQIENLFTFPTSDLPKSQWKAHERYLQKHSKLLNLQLEIDRIEAKRDISENGLSSGQENTILKNLTKLQTLQSDLDGIEKEIRDAVGAKEKRESGAKKFVSKESGFYDEEEDLFDRTKESKEGGEVIKGGDLGKRAGFLRGRRRVEVGLKRKRGVRGGLVGKRAKAEEDEDEVEVYVKTEEIKGLDREIRVLEDEFEKIEKSIKEVEEDLDLVKSGWREYEYDEDGAKIVAAMAPPRAMAPPPKAMAPQPRAIEPPAPPKVEKVEEKKGEKRKEPPSTTMGVALPDTFMKGMAGGFAGPPPKKAATTVKKVPSWVALANKSQSSDPKSEKKIVEKKKNTDKEITWQAPKNQDGSGKTKLNEKFAGRY